MMEKKCSYLRGISLEQGYNVSSLQKKKKSTAQAQIQGNWIIKFYMKRGNFN